jgi:hypothetical protein
MMSATSILFCTSAAVHPCHFYYLVVNSEKLSGDFALYFMKRLLHQLQIPAFAGTLFYPTFTLHCHLPMQAR